MLSDGSSEDSPEDSPSPIGIQIKTEIDKIDINDQKSKWVEISLQTPEPEIVNNVLSTIEEEKKDEIVDLEKGEEVGRARLWRHMLDKDESLMEKIIKENIKIFDGDLVLPCAPTDQEKTMYYSTCLLYTSPSPRDRQKSRMPSSA